MSAYSIGGEGSRLCSNCGGASGAYKKLKVDPKVPKMGRKVPFIGTLEYVAFKEQMLKVNDNTEQD